MRLFLLIICCVFSTSAFSKGLKLVPIATDLPASWSITLLDDEQLLLTHRQGGLGLVKGESIKFIEFQPQDLFAQGQGGLLDIALHPEYISNGWLYLSYAAGTLEDNYLKIVRFKLQNLQSDSPSVTSVEQIFRVAQSKDTPVHFSGRMAFDQQGYLLITTGDGFDYREQAQITSSHLGKILRMSDTGKAVPDNPFYSQADAPESFVFSKGHRNSQGLIVLPEGTIIAHEHGPAGGDEMNIIKSGVNYGWPVVTNGMDYIGATISPFKDYPGMQLPALDWTPSIAPSSMIFYQGNKFPALQDHYLVTGLKFMRLYVINKNFEPDATLFAETQTRLRDIAASKKGDIYILGDGEPATLYKVMEK
ncbi:PQQ-dependent sugar dehydrogenase [Glaciecola sp. 1036]|uniref:PQQ-dependent sugar dehydrogenase n=1 Tax=Alteromonadaceae TaxID=72275 RepID=UPI003D029DCB